MASSTPFVLSDVLMLNSTYVSLHRWQRSRSCRCPRRRRCRCYRCCCCCWYVDRRSSRILACRSFSHRLLRVSPIDSLHLHMRRYKIQDASSSAFKRLDDDEWERWCLLLVYLPDILPCITPSLKCLLHKASSHAAASHAVDEDDE